MAIDRLSRASRAPGPEEQGPEQQRSRVQSWVLPTDASLMAQELRGRATFPAAGTDVACAVSGGADSLALLVLAVAAGCRAHAVHVDHGLRPDSWSEGDVVAQAAERLGASYEQVRVKVPPGPDLEARARRARYQALPEGVMTGHTADDQAETLLLNLLRGAGLDGMRAMRVVGGPRGARRPILALRRHETAELVRLSGLRMVDDPSNSDPRFKRNRVRHEVLPLLADVAGRDPVPLMARTAQLLGQDADYLGACARTIDPTDVRELCLAPKPVADRALRQWLGQGQGAERHPPSQAELARVWRVVDGTVKACEVAGGRRVARSRGRLYVSE